MKERHKKIIAAEAKLIQKQQNEMNALKKKLEANLNERLKLRETEHNKLLQRYQNVKKEIENSQNIEICIIKEKKIEMLDQEKLDTIVAAVNKAKEEAEEAKKNKNKKV